MCKPYYAYHEEFLDIQAKNDTPEYFGSRIKLPNLENFQLLEAKFMNSFGPKVKNIIAHWAVNESSSTFIPYIVC